MPAFDALLLRPSQRCIYMRYRATARGVSRETHLTKYNKNDFDSICFCILLMLQSFKSFKRVFRGKLSNNS